MVSLPYNDVPNRMSVRHGRHALLAAAHFNRRLLFALGLNIVLWAGIGVVLRLAF